ncbi:hypothetical protein P7C70_g6317, partial [Phenoliferia sp. Uapishka_3]
MITVKVDGLTISGRSVPVWPSKSPLPVPQGGGNSVDLDQELDPPASLTFEVPDSTTLEGVKELLKERGFDRVSFISKIERSFGNLEIKISDQEENCFEAGNLVIGRLTTLAQFHDGWLAVQGVESVGAPNKDAGIYIGGIHIHVGLTFRVPDNNDDDSPPPGLRRSYFRSVESSRYAPEGIKARGGFVVPFFQQAALCASFDDPKEKRPAVKVSIGGMPRDAVASKFGGPFQDYMVAGSHPWLYGIRTGPESVRQIVPMPLGEARAGRLQFDIFPRLDDGVVFYDANRENIQPSQLHQTPGALQLTGTLLMQSLSRDISLGASLSRTNNSSTSPVLLRAICPWEWMRRRNPCNAPTGSFPIYIKTLTEKLIKIEVEATFTSAEVKLLVEKQTGIPPTQQRLLFAGKIFQDHHSLWDCYVDKDATVHLVLTLRHPIEFDCLPASAYQSTPAHRVFVHTVSGELYLKMYGDVAPLDSKRREQDLVDIDKQKNITGVSVAQLGDEKVRTIWLEEDSVNGLHGRN